MSRKKIIKKTLFQKDLFYNNILITLIINRLLKHGKKNLAKKIIYKTLNYIFIKTKKNPLLILEKAIKNISPRVILRNKFRQGIVTKIPILLNIFDSTLIAICWLLKITIKKSKKQLFIKLGIEILDAFKGIGNTIKKKEEIHKIAKSNKTFIFNN